MSKSFHPDTSPEHGRLFEDDQRKKNWKRWGPYLSERQWGTVREDYTPDSDSWAGFTHDEARKRAYRWGEDGILGITDRQCRLCFGLSFWNGKDPILKERLFGLTGPEGNHGEDCKEKYFYIDASPTHSYLKGSYYYPYAAYPYEELIRENQKRGYQDREYEIDDTGVFDENRFFIVSAEYAKEGPDDLLIQVTIENKGDETQEIHFLPQLWFRNTWVWGCEHEGCTLKPTIKKIVGEERLSTEHESLSTFTFYADPQNSDDAPEWLFAENETNTKALYGNDHYTPYTKDAFHRYVIDRESGAVNPEQVGTKSAIHYREVIPASGKKIYRFRLTNATPSESDPFAGFDKIVSTRIQETDTFYESVQPVHLSDEEKMIHRQASAGLLWTKQFYHYSVHDWLQGDRDQPAPPEKRLAGRNKHWQHLFNRDILSMPDKWEYPWFAAWDSAFHMIPFCHIDPFFAKDQLLLFLREWYMHPNGQIPAYEYNFSDVNPPVHAWACWRVYKITGEKGSRDIKFLSRAFHKLLINFTWWVNRKDPHGNNIFAGGFLGLDNIGVFDRSKPLPNGGELEQADGTAWMAFYCSTMLSIALELASHDSSYEDVASKFFEHFANIAQAINRQGGTGLWDEEEGFFYDRLFMNGEHLPIKIRSLVGLVPLFAVEVLEESTLDKLPNFRKRMDWFLEHRKDLIHETFIAEKDARPRHLLAIAGKDRLTKILQYLVDQEEFLSDFGIRSMSKYYQETPYHFSCGEEEYRISYVPGDSDTGLFGGNSNWRGPIWFPMNYLLIESLEKYYHFYGDSFQLEYPAGSGQMHHLQYIAQDISKRLSSLFKKNLDAVIPATPHQKEEPLLFHEFFHGDTGEGLGASHQTGWTALVAKLLQSKCKEDQS